MGTPRGITHLESTEVKTFNIDELPKYSPWPKRLLSAEPKFYAKTPDQIQREYGTEKWGVLLSRWRENGPASLAQVDSWSWEGIATMPGLMQAVPTLMTPPDAKNAYLGIIEDLLSPLDSTRLVELGCGYGSILLSLLLRGKLRVRESWGGEYTSSGIELGAEIAKQEGLATHMGRCDFFSKELADFDIPQGCGILTSYSIAYVHEAKPVLESIIDRKPAWVLHMEPLFELSDTGTLLGMLQQRYISTNDYNQTLSSDLFRLRDEGRIEIQTLRPAVFGNNCLLPASAVLWRPI